MIGSRNSSVAGRAALVWSARLVPLAAGLAMLCLAGGLAAQESEADAPMRLFPLDSERQTETIQLRPPPETEETVQPEAEGALEEAGEDGIQIGTLEEVDPDSVGLFSDRYGGFPSDLWRETSRRLVESLLPRLPIEAPSPTMRSLALRLLLSPGKPPEGEGERGALLHRRALALAGMGEYDVAIEMLRAASGVDFGESLARLESDRRFRDLDYVAACGQVNENIRQFSNPYWLKALVFCQALEGEFEAASLGLDLLRESGGSGDETLATVVLAMRGEVEPVIETLPNPTPLHIAMLRAVKVAPPESALVTANPAVLRLIAAAPEVSIAVRLNAAERAEAVGALPAGSIAQLYASVQFSAEEKANPISAAESLAGPLSRALLYQAVIAEPVPTARAEILRVALDKARAAGRFTTMARTALIAVQELVVGPEMVWFAADAGRALFAAGRWDEAVRWFDLAAQQSSLNQEAAAAAVALWPLAALTSEVEEVDVAMLEAWWNAQGGAADPRGHARAGMLLSLLQALGRGVPRQYWERLLTGPLSQPATMTSPALHHALRDAAANRRLGGTVLLALLSLGDGGPAAAGLPTLEAVVTSLRLVGLESDARSLALEAALAAGL